MKPGRKGLLQVFECVAPSASAGLDHREAAVNEEVTATRADGTEDPALDDDGAQRAFGIVVGGRDIGVEA